MTFYFYIYRVCEGEWKKHFGYTCEQMKRKNDDDVLRAMSDVQII